MSDERVASILMTFRNASLAGKKILKIELFPAWQFKRAWNPYKRKMYPHPPASDPGYWKRFYRMRINGRWHGIFGYKYAFFTISQAVEHIERLAREAE